MIEVSQEFKELVAQGNPNWQVQLDISLANGDLLHIENDQIWSTGFRIDDAVSAPDTFGAIGSCIINSFEVVLNNKYSDFSDYDFYDARVVVYIGLIINDNLERIKKGTFTVTEANYDGILISLQALDNAMRLDDDYSKSTLEYPATLLQIMQDACERCNITFGTSSFPRSDLSIPTRPDDKALTFREVVSWVAMIAGCYARCDVNGTLRFGWFDTATLSALQNIYDGGIFDDHTPKYATGVDIDGGGFNPWNIGYVINMGGYADIANAHNIYSIFDYNASYNNVVITGVKAVLQVEDEEGSTEEKTYIAGDTGYVVSLENNMFITTQNAQFIINALGNQIIGMTFRKANATCLSDPTIEAGDVAFFWDPRIRVSYPILISESEFEIGNNQRIYSHAETPARNQSVRYTEGVKNYVELNQKLVEEKSARERALDQLSKRLAEQSGLYSTVQQTASGNIYYLHDQASVEDSTIIWKMNAEAWGVSTDGGQTWNAGMTVDGDTIVRILSATGINADWIRAGTLTLGGQNNQNGVLRVLNSSGTEIGKWDNTGAQIIGLLTLQKIVNDHTITTNIGSVTYPDISEYSSKIKWATAQGLSIEDKKSGNILMQRAFVPTSQFLRDIIFVGDQDYMSTVVKGTSTTGIVFTDRVGKLQTVNSTAEIGYKKIISQYGSSTMQTETMEMVTNLRTAFKRFWATKTRLLIGGELSLEQLPVGDPTSSQYSTNYPYINIMGGGIEINANRTIQLKRDNSVIEVVPSGSNSSFHVSANGATTYLDLTFKGSSVYTPSINGRTIQFESSSSKRYKHNITEKLDKTLSQELLYKLKIKQFVYNSDASLQYNDMKDKTIPGFIAEDVDEIYPAAVIHNDKGEVESWDERRILPPMLALIQDQKKQIDDLKDRVAKLEAMVNSLIDRR